MVRNYLKMIMKWGGNMNKIVIERCKMSGGKYKNTYRLKIGEKVLFQKPDGSFLAWTRKKDAKEVLDALFSHGIDYVEKKLKTQL